MRLTASEKQQAFLYTQRNTEEGKRLDKAYPMTGKATREQQQFLSRKEVQNFLMLLNENPNINIK